MVYNSNEFIQIRTYEIVFKKDLHKYKLMCTNSYEFVHTKSYKKRITYINVCEFIIQICIRIRTYLQSADTKKKLKFRKKESWVSVSSYVFSWDWDFLENDSCEMRILMRLYETKSHEISWPSLTRSHAITNSYVACVAFCCGGIF